MFINNNKFEFDSEMYLLLNCSKNPSKRKKQPITTRTKWSMSVILDTGQNNKLAPF